MSIPNIRREESTARRPPKKSAKVSSEEDRAGDVPDDESSEIQFSVSHAQNAQC